MAQFLNISEVREYVLSNGRTADLIALISDNVPQSWIRPTHAPEVGTVVFVDAMGRMRCGVVSKVTRTKVYVSLTTRGAITAYMQSGKVRVQTVVADPNYVFVAPQDKPKKTQYTVTRTRNGEPASNLIVFAASVEEAMNIGGGFKAISAVPSEELTPNSQDGKVDPESENNEPQGDEMTTETKPLDTSSELAQTVIEADHTEVERERTGSAVVRLLEKVYARIRENHPELPELVIVTGSGLRGDNKWGHFRAKGWNAKVAEEGAATYLDEMFMAGETLAKGAKQVLQTMLHESAHTLCALRKIQDTSRQGRWHNKEFRKAAEEMGLEHPAATADKAHGYAFVKLTEATIAEYADLLAELEAEIHLTVSLPVWMGGSEDEGEKGGDGMGRAPRGEGGSSNGSNLKLVCQCETPNIIRASKKVADLRVVNCGDCDSLFRPERS